MLKVFNRGNKSQLTDSHVPESAPQTSNYRRQASLRHSHYFGHTENYATLGSLKQGGKANLINSKKYISCENVRQSTEEYQDVIDEDSSDDENGLKEKIAKRYNSLTTLLMKSFRKAKIKKKKEAMMNESIRNEIFEEKLVASPRPSAERRSSLRPNETPLLPPRHESSKKNKPTEIPGQTNTATFRSQPVSKKNFFHQNNPASSNENKIKSEETQRSNNNDDLDNENDDDDTQDESVPVFLGVKMISNEFVDLKPTGKTSQVENQSKIACSSRSSELTFNSITEKKSENRNLENKRDFSQDEIKITPKTTKKNQSPQTSKLDEPKKVSDCARFSISSVNKPQAPIAPAQIEKIDEIISTSETRSLSLKRTKTFTQQLQEMLLERKRNSAQSEQNRQDLIEDSEQENSKLNTRLSDNKSIGYYDTINSSKSLYQDVDDLNYIKQIKNNFNESSMLKDSLLSQLSISNYSNDESSDDFKDLVQVLAKQDNLFKKKFFDCLMTKLWDTTLPYNEYLQLNKLMSALFGENYHKLDTSYLSSCSQNRTAKLNSEQVVKLVKMFLDSNSSENSSNVQNDDLNFEYFSVANLISTLKRRQKNEPLSLEPASFNSKFDKNSKIEVDLELERIQFLNGINQAKNSSPKLENSEPEAAKINSQNQINYFARNRLRNTMGNLDSLLAQYSCGPVRSIQTVSADSSASFQSVKYCTLRHDETKPNVCKSIVLNTPTKSSGIIASFQPSQFAHQDSPKRNPSREAQPTFVTSKMINLNKQCPPKPKISVNEKEAMNSRINKIRSVRELFKNDENMTNFPKKNDIAMVKAENLVYAQFDNTISIATLPSKKALLSSSVDSKTLNKSISSPYTSVKKLQLPGIYSTLGSKKDAGDVIYYHPNQLKLNGFEKSNQIVSNRILKDSRIYESKSTKNYQLNGIIADKIYKHNSREMNQAYY